MKTPVALSLMTAALIGFGAVVGSVASANDPTPPSPAWVNPDGSVDESKLPTDMPVVDSEGRIIPGKTFNAREDARGPAGGAKPPTAAELKAEKEKGIKRYIDPKDGAEVIELPTQP